MYYNLYCATNGSWDTNKKDQIHIQYQISKYNKKNLNCIDRFVTTPYDNNTNISTHGITANQEKKINSTCEKYGLKYSIKKNSSGKSEYVCTGVTNFCR
jgi:hypothetical protein